MDILNKLDPMPCGFGPAIKPAPKPTAAELRAKELREFETKTDKLVWYGVDFGRLIDEICGVPLAFRASNVAGTTVTEMQLRFFYGTRGR